MKKIDTFTILPSRVALSSNAILSILGNRTRKLMDLETRVED